MRRDSLASLKSCLLPHFSFQRISSILVACWGLWICALHMPKVSSGRRLYTVNTLTEKKLSTSQFHRDHCSGLSLYSVTWGKGRWCEWRVFIFCLLLESFNHTWNNTLFKKHLDTVHIAFKMLLATHHSCNQGKCSSWWEREGKEISIIFSWKLNPQLRTEFTIQESRR